MNQDKNCGFLAKIIIHKYIKGISFFAEELSLFWDIKKVASIYYT